MRVSLRHWLDSCTMVSMTVPPNPQSAQLAQLISILCGLRGPDGLLRLAMVWHAFVPLDAPVQRERRVDKTDVRIALGEISQCLTGGGIDLLAEEAEVIGIGEQPRNGILRVFFRVSAHGHVFRSPEAADGEGPFLLHHAADPGVAL